MISVNLEVLKVFGSNEKILRFEKFGSLENDNADFKLSKLSV